MSHLRRRDPARNMARFYAMEIQRSLFGDYLLVRRWGRIGTGGQTLTEWFADRDAALARQDSLDRTKRRRGYAEA